MKTSILRQLFDFNLPVRKTHFDRVRVDEEHV